MMPPSPMLTLKESLESGVLRSSLYGGRRQMQGQGGLGQGLLNICRLLSLHVKGLAALCREWPQSCWRC